MKAIRAAESKFWSTSPPDSFTLAAGDRRQVYLVDAQGNVIYQPPASETGTPVGTPVRTAAVVAMIADGSPATILPASPLPDQAERRAKLREQGI